MFINPYSTRHAMSYRFTDSGAFFQIPLSELCKSLGERLLSIGPPTFMNRMSEHASILTALSLPAVSSLPSLYCLQWTGDGQILLLTKAAVYILTPEAGVAVERSSIIKQAPGIENALNSIKPVGWFRTMIEFDKALFHHWPADCQVSLGSLDPFLRAISPSPSNLTANAGCVVAVLNSNMELTIWGPVKNHLRGQWTKLVDVTAELRAKSTAAEEESALVRTLDAQPTCIEWSPQVDFRLSPTPDLDGSLLATGNRAGSVTFLRLCGNIDESWQVRNTASISISSKWVTHLTWASWKASECHKCETLLACGIADGSVVTVKVVQYLRLTPSAIELTPKYSIEESFEVQDICPCRSDGRGITGMRWICTTERNPILAIFKPGTVHLWSDSSVNGWSGSRTLAIRAPKVSAGSSALCSVSGTAYVRRRDALVFSLSDGSFHVVHALSTAPSLDPSSSDSGLAAERLSLMGRSVFAKAESERMKYKDVNRINGMTAYSENGTFVWIHEASRPTDFSYKHDAKHMSMFVVAQLWKGDAEEQLVNELITCIIAAKACTGQSPIALLRFAFLRLRDPTMLSRAHAALLEVLSPFPQLENIVQVAVPSYTGELTSEVRQQLKKSLSMHLFGWDAVFSQRMKLTVAYFCQRHCEEPQVEESLVKVSNCLFSSIWQHCLRTIIRHIGAVVQLLTPDDIPFILRVIVQASLPNSIPGLKEEADKLLNRARSNILQAESAAASDDGVYESCPACHARIQLEDISVAECPNGHVWARCSITSLILTTPMVRTCIGCGRKALLPLPQVPVGQNWVPEAARSSWLAQDLLEATRRCFFCGNNFVTLV
ncbi:hypothetical protein AcV5_002680 [Taiwanofungus camphoratus]|nr:hypothetical protein AcV5_002680 [Antrodia cinnamomea]